MAINFPDNRDQLVPPQPSGDIQTGDVYVYQGTTYTATVLNNGAVRWDAAVSAGSDAYVLKVGDTMTGQLTLPGGGTGSEAATVDQIPAALWQRDNNASRLTPATAGDSVAVVNADQAVFTVGEGLDGSGSNHLGVYYGDQITGTDSADLFTSNGDLRIHTDGNNAATTSVVRFMSGFNAQDPNGPTTVTIAPGTGNITTTGDVQTTSLNSGPLSGFRNQLINGDFRVRQYFSNGTGSNKYITDRWCTNDSTTGATPDVTDVNGASKGLRLDGGSRIIRQVVELPDDGLAGQFYNGSQWTMSIYSTVAPDQLDVRFCEGGVNLGTSVQVTGVPGWTATSDVQGSFTRYTCTFNVNVNPDSTSKGFRVSWSFASAATFTLAQLEPGPVASVFEQRPIQTELALCQRYYRVSGVDNPPASTPRCLIGIDGVKASNTTARMTFDSTGMRTVASPTVSVIGAMSDLAVSVTDGTSALSSINGISGRDNTIFFVANFGNSAATNGSPVQLVQAGSSVKLAIDAEL